MDSSVCSMSLLIRQAGLGEVRQGPERRGSAGGARRGEAGLGKARQAWLGGGMAGYGVARHGRRVGACRGTAV